MPLLETFEVYADYGTFVLTPQIGGDFDFPSEGLENSLEKGFRLEGGSLVVYLPEVESYELTVEVHIDDWTDPATESDIAFSTELSIEKSPLKIYGLLDDADNKPSFNLERGHYECSVRGYLGDDKHLFQLRLRKRVESLS